MNNLTDKQRTYVESHHQAAMITIGEDGIPKAVRVAVAVVDGKLWSSGTAARVRTERLRTNPACTLYLIDPGYSFLTLETTVRLIEGPDVPALSVNLFRTMQNMPTGDIAWFGKPMPEADFIAAMAADHRLIYEFEVTRAYGTT